MYRIRQSGHGFYGRVEAQNLTRNQVVAWIDDYRGTLDKLTVERFDTVTLEWEKIPAVNFLVRIA